MGFIAEPLIVPPTKQATVTAEPIEIPAKDFIAFPCTAEPIIIKSKKNVSNISRINDCQIFPEGVVAPKLPKLPNKKESVYAAKIEAKDWIKIYESAFLYFISPRNKKLSDTTGLKCAPEI
jgi:hypothetical protein